MKKIFLNFSYPHWLKGREKRDKRIEKKKECREKVNLKYKYLQRLREYTVSPKKEYCPMKIRNKNKKELPHI